MACCVPRTTLLRQVDGQDAHVYAWEPNLIDRYRKDGEAIVKEVGSGTTNGSLIEFDAPFSTHIVPATAELGAELPILDELIAVKILLSSVLKEAKP